MRIRKLQVLGTLILMAALPCVAQQGEGNDCTPAGTWYGGSVVAYFMTITPAGPAGHYAVTAQGMYKNSVLNTSYAGTIVKNGKKYEGPTMSLSTQDPSFLGLPPYTTLPDLSVGWVITEMMDCNTLQSTIPFLGLYSAASIWQPGTPWSGINWLAKGKVPLDSPPDIDLIPVLTGDIKPIVETYHRVPETVNPELLHK